MHSGHSYLRLSVTQSRNRGVLSHGSNTLFSREDILSAVEGTATPSRTSNLRTRGNNVASMTGQK